MMSLWALIVDGRVHEITDIDPADRFTPDLDWRACAGDVNVGWVVVEDTIVPPAAAPVHPTDLVAYARDARWRAEVGGMLWNDIPIATDDSSKVKIAGARLAAQANPAFETTWWGSHGEGVVVDAPLIIALSDAVLAHVDATFTTFGLVKAGIDTGAITSRAQIDTAFAAAQP